MDLIFLVPHAYLATAPTIIREYANITGESYIDTGCVSSQTIRSYATGEYRFSMVPGNYEVLMSKLNASTKGEYDIKIDGGLPEADQSAKPARGRGGGRGKGRKW